MYEHARVHCALGELPAALAWIERAASAGLRLPAAMAPDPELRPLEDDARYRAALDRMGVTPDRR